MSNNRKFFILIVLLLLGEVSLVAQQSEAVPVLSLPEIEASRQTERMKTDLQLTPVQEKLVYNICLKYERERQEATQNSRLKSLERFRNKMEELQQVLTKKQFEQLQHLRYNTATFQREDQREKRSLSPPKK